MNVSMAFIQVKPTFKKEWKLGMREGACSFMGLFGCAKLKANVLVPPNNPITEWKLGMREGACSFMGLFGGAQS